MSSNNYEKIRELIRNLSSDERKVLNYFITYRSVGELVAIRELRGLYGIKEPLKIVIRLIDLGLIERGIGCYNLAKELRVHEK